MLLPAAGGSLRAAVSGLCADLTTAQRIRGWGGGMQKHFFFRSNYLYLTSLISYFSILIKKKIHFMLETRIFLKLESFSLLNPSL